MATPSISISSETSPSIQADSIDITVNTTGGKSINLKVNPTHTVANLLEFLSASATLPAGSRLLLAGKQLDPATTVSELQLSESSTLNLFTPSPRNSQEPESSEMTTTTLAAESPAPSSTTTSGTSTPTSTKRKSNKPRCTKDGCKALAQPIVGDCGFCQKRFCGKHRMLESHNCTGLEDARQADKDRNTAKLEHERTIMLRGL